MIWKSGHLRRSPTAGALQVRQALFYGDAPKTPRYAKFEPMSPKEPMSSGDHRPELGAWVLRYETREPFRWQYEVPDLVYSPDGIVRVAGAVEPDISSSRHFGAASTLSLLLARPSETLPQGTIIERQYPNTYGDYCSEDLKPLVLADRLLEPVIFPKSFEDRSYLHRDMQRLGIAYRFADRTLLIKNALVLRKTQPVNYWSEVEVREYRKRLGIDPPPPRPGSILYLSRRNVRSSRKGGAGQTDSSALEEVIPFLGGRIVDTEGMYFEDFLKLADEAETVIADHGAAMFNLLLWRPLQVIEMVPDDWWSPCFVVLSQHLKVRRHITLNQSSYGGNQLETLLRALVASGGTGAPLPEDQFLRHP